LLDRIGSGNDLIGLVKMQLPPKVFQGIVLTGFAPMVAPALVFRSA
jgi:hypothetical protein